MANFLFILEFISALLLLSWILQRWVYSIWWTPLMLERCLKKQGIVGPSYVLLSGNLKDNARFMKEARSKPMDLSHKIVPRVAPFLHDTVNKYGKMSVTWFGTKPRVSIMDPQLIKEVLSNKFGHFEKPKSNPFVRLLATGVANYDGEKWAKHRRIINPAFHLEKIKRMLPAFSTSCIEMIGRWESLASGEGAYELDVWPQLQNLTGDVISRTAFGSNYKEGDRIFKLQTEQAELIIQAVMSVYIPGFRFLPTKKNLRRNEINREVRSLLTAIIKKREKAMRLGEAPTDDLLGLLMESSSKDSQEYGDTEGLTIEDVIEECKLFYFAGQETTSVLLTWTMVVLSMNPNWQTRARDEVIQTFGRNTPDVNGLNHLKIVTMILYEVLRLYPPVINLLRSTYKEMTLGGVTFPPGVQLSLPTLLVHHDPELWGEDADEFNPERFSGGISKATNSQVSFFPFGWGPRICIGQNFALSEAKIILAMILQKFWFELSPSYVHAPYTVITLQPQYGAQIILHTLTDGTR